MATAIANTFKRLASGSVAVALTAAIAFVVSPDTARAHDDPVVGPHIHKTYEGNRRQVTVQASPYKPTIWVDPDGCQHWVMDDGVEGYMTPNVNRHGIPVCNRGNACAVMNTDQLFATDRFVIHAAGRQRLTEFFQSANATAFVIVGHTDSRASDAYNMRLGLNRAKAVAAVGKSAGARIVDIRTHGERMPKATNASASGRAKNRRVEIMCIR